MSPLPPSVAAEKHSGDSAADEQGLRPTGPAVFQKHSRRLRRATRFEKRLSKTWISGAEALVDGRAPNGISQIISEAKGQVGACVVEMHASGESLRAMLDHGLRRLIHRRHRTQGAFDGPFPPPMSPFS